MQRRRFRPIDGCVKFLAKNKETGNIEVVEVPYHGLITVNYGLITLIELALDGILYTHEALNIEASFLKDNSTRNEFLNSLHGNGALFLEVPSEIKINPFNATTEWYEGKGGEEFQVVKFAQSKKSYCVFHGTKYEWVKLEHCTEIHRELIF